MLPEVREKYQLESLHLFGPEFDSVICQTTWKSVLWFQTFDYKFVLVFLKLELYI